MKNKLIALAITLAVAILPYVIFTSPYCLQIVGGIIFMGLFYIIYKINYWLVVDITGGHQRAKTYKEDK